MLKKTMENNEEKVLNFKHLKENEDYLTIGDLKIIMGFE